MALDLELAAQLAALVLLLLGSAFFSMTETALISASRIQIRARREEGDARAAALERLLKDPERLITAVLVGNNVVNVGASVLSAVVALRVLGGVGAAVAAGLMVLVILVFGEITPKTLAVRHATGIALRVARPMMVVQAALAPLAWFFGHVANAVLRLGGIKRPGRAPFITEEEIRLLLRVGEEQGTIERFERRVIDEVFDFTDTKAHRVMTPRDSIVSVGKGASLAEALDVVNKSGYSRILVVDGSLDRVVGFVHAKDLLRFTDVELKERRAGDVARRVLVAPASLNTAELLLRMQRVHTQLAVVQDSMGATVGLLTIEDLLEELVGEIHDEFDVPLAAPPDGGAHEAPASEPEAQAPKGDAPRA